MAVLTKVLQSIAGCFGLTVQRTPPTRDMEPQFLEIFEKARSFTMTSVERAYGVYKAVEYITRCNIPGDIVECGVWRGGSSMVAALSLKAFSPESPRSFFLYDTYEGMSEPTAHDVDFRGDDAKGEWARSKRNDHNEWCYASLEDVRRNLLSTGIPAERLRFIKGKVEDTIPKEMPASIALLRLDTDWYESTRHEFEHLYPLLSKGGVLLLDDYGHWKGAKEATDAYLSQHRIPILLARLDYTGRVGIKP